MIGRLVVMVACCAVIVACTFVTVRAIRGRDVCGALDDQGTAIRALIVKGTVDSKPFDAQLRKLGFPPYSVRLQRAYAQAATIRGCSDT